MSPGLLDRDDRIAALERANDDLRARIDMLEQALFEEVPQAGIRFGLTGAESTVFALLVARGGQATKEQIYAALYSMRTENEQPEPKIVDVLVCKLRKKLKKFGVSIETLWGVGYGLSPEARAKIGELMK